MLKTYMHQLESIAATKGLTLLEAFELADVPNSTFYRARKKGSDLRRETAEKIARSLDDLPDIQPESAPSTNSAKSLSPYARAG